MLNIITRINAITPQTSLNDLYTLGEEALNYPSDSMFLLSALCEAIIQKSASHMDAFVQWAHGKLSNDDKHIFLFENVRDTSLLSVTTLNMFKDIPAYILMKIDEQTLGDMEQSPCVVMASILKNPSIFQEKFYKEWKLLLGSYPELLDAINTDIINHLQIPLLDHLFHGARYEKNIKQKFFTWLSKYTDTIQPYVTSNHLYQLSEVSATSDEDNLRRQFIHNLSADQRYFYVENAIQQDRITRGVRYVLEHYPDSRYVMLLMDNPDLSSSLNVTNLHTHWKGDIKEIVPFVPGALNIDHFEKIFSPFTSRDASGNGAMVKLKKFLDMGMGSALMYPSNGGISPAWCYMYFYQDDIVATIPPKWGSIKNAIQVLNRYLEAFLRPLEDYHESIKTWLGVRYTVDSWKEEIGMDLTKIHKEHRSLEEEWITNVSIYLQNGVSFEISGADEEMLAASWKNIQKNARKKRKKKGFNIEELDGYTKELETLPDFLIPGDICENSDLRYMLSLLEKTHCRDFEPFFNQIPASPHVEHPMHRLYEHQQEYNHLFL